MKKTTLIASILSLAILPTVDATTVTWGAVPSARTALSSLGAQLATTSLVLAGNFLNEGFSFNSAITVQANYAAISAAGGWKQFTLDTDTRQPNAGVTNTLGINAAGKVGGTLTDNNFGATKADYFNGKAVYVWIFNASSIAAATEMGIFKATAATTPWIFPTNGGGLADSVTLSTAPAVATIASVAGAGIATGSSMSLSAAVPEPSTALLSVIGLLGMASRRRRNRH